MLGKRVVHLRHASPKHLIAPGSAAGTFVQALRHLGPVRAAVVAHIAARCLSARDKQMLASTAVQAPAWMRPTLITIANAASGDIDGQCRASSCRRSGGSLWRDRRFSEAIDLSFDRADFGYSDDRDPQKDGISRKSADQLIKDLVSDVGVHIAVKLRPALHAAIAEQLGDPTDGDWPLEIDAADAQSVNFRYPTALPDAGYEGMGLYHTAGEARTRRTRRSLADRGEGHSPTKNSAVDASSAAVLMSQRARLRQASHVVVILGS